MSTKLRKVGLAAATAIAIAGMTVALPGAADARWGGWHGGYWRGGGWGWGGVGLGLATGLAIAATAPYYRGYYGYAPYYYGGYPYAYGYGYPAYGYGYPYGYRRAYYRYGGYAPYYRYSRRPYYRYAY
jgi:hypothetical protein